MITQDELEMFIDEFIQPIYVSESHCGSDSCPIDFKGSRDDNQ